MTLSKMQTSDMGIMLIKKFEGLRLTAYQCSAHVWTIGYGHTAGVKPGGIITVGQAAQFLRDDLSHFEVAVSSLVIVPLSQHQFDALVSFTFNLGESNLKSGRINPPPSGRTGYVFSMMWRYWKIVLVAGSVVAAIAAFSHWRWQAGFNEAEGKWQQRWSQRDADDATALAKRQTEARNEEQRRQNEINEIRNSAAQQLAVVQADASTARAAADRLHNSAEILARRLADRERTCQSAPAGAGQAAGSGAVLLAELFRSADERAGELAAAADEARARGLACERAYDALSRTR